MLSAASIMLIGSTFWPVGALKGKAGRVVLSICLIMMADVRLMGGSEGSPDDVNTRLMSLTLLLQFGEVKVMVMDVCFKMMQR